MAHGFWEIVHFLSATGGRSSDDEGIKRRGTGGLPPGGEGGRKRENAEHALLCWMEKNDGGAIGRVGAGVRLERHTRTTSTVLESVEESVLVGHSAYSSNVPPLPGRVVCPLRPRGSRAGDATCGSPA